MSFSKLYVGNLNYKTTEETLKGLFAQFDGRKLIVNDARPRTERPGGDRRPGGPGGGDRRGFSKF
jgi:RNA recognition motif-containing protein